MSQPAARARFRAELLVLALLGIAGCESTEPARTGTGPPATLQFSNPVASTAFTRNVVAAGPVRVLDAQGLPLFGAQVRFSIEGDGELASSVLYTDRNGEALVGWRLGPTPGPHRLIAEAGDLTLTAAVEAVQPPQPAFTVTLHFVRNDGLITGDSLAIVRAALRWEEMVVGDLPNMPMPDALPEGCPPVPALRGTPVDDLLVLVVAGTLQGLAARTTICARRPGGGLPFVATIRLDPAKARASDGIRATMAHEIGHALGIGTLWGAKVLDYDGDLRYAGAHATAAWQLVAGALAFLGHPGVPVHSRDGEGVARVHWSEEVLRTELLTPFADRGVAEPISVITAASLRDLGYVVDDSKADPFVVAGATPIGLLRGSPTYPPAPDASRTALR